MPTKDRTWFERKVRELGNVLRGLPRARERALHDAIETAPPASEAPTIERKPPRKPKA